MHTVRLALEAMATRFELVLCGENKVRLRAAGEEALREIRQLDAELSFYRPSSYISRLNAQASKAPVRIPLRLFRLLQNAAVLHKATQGAFDITVAPLMRCWGFVKGTGKWPQESALEQARSSTGMHLVTLDEENLSVHFRHPGVLLDLGAIGKGFAIEEAAHILQECGVKNAFLHGGTSTMVAIGTPPKNETWKVAIAHPTREETPLAIVPLCNEALSVSAPHGKAFVKNGKTYGHVLDPRTGYPVRGALLAAITHASATVCDALSTALLVLGCDKRELISHISHNTRTLAVCTDDKGNMNTYRTGFDLYDGPLTHA